MNSIGTNEHTEDAEYEAA